MCLPKKASNYYEYLLVPTASLPSIVHFSVSAVEQLLSLPVFAPTESSLYRCLLLHIIADHGARLKTLISTWIVLYVLTYYRV